MELRIVGFHSHTFTAPIPAHRRMHGGIIAVTEGMGHIGVGCRSDSSPEEIVEFAVRPGDTVVFLPYEDHSYRPDNETPLSFTMIRFELLPDSDLALSLARLENNRRFRDIPELDSLLRFIRSALEEDNEYAVRAAEASAVGVLFRAVAASVRIPARSRESPMDRAMEVLYGDFSSRLNMVAENLGLSAETMRKVFHRHFDDTPMRYFMAFRISSIASRLETSDAPLSALAEEFGFHDEFHLNRVFKNHIGVPPGEYRRRFR